MKNYYYNLGDRMFEFDATGDFPQIDTVKIGINIDYSYRIKEDGILHVKNYKGDITDYEVKKNDVVLLMYSNTRDYRDRQIIVIRDNQFNDYFNTLDETDEKVRQERENTTECINNCDSCCDECNCCEKVSL